MLPHHLHLNIHYLQWWWSASRKLGGVMWLFEISMEFLAWGLLWQETTTSLEWRWKNLNALFFEDLFAVSQTAACCEVSWVDCHRTALAALLAVKTKTKQNTKIIIIKSSEQRLVSRKTRFLSQSTTVSSFYLMYIFSICNSCSNTHSHHCATC